MKYSFVLLFFVVNVSCAQYVSKTDLNNALKILNTTNTNQDAIIKKLVADTTYKAKQIMALQSSLLALQKKTDSLTVQLSTDFLIENKSISIPQLKILSDRISKLEAKP